MIRPTPGRIRAIYRSAGLLRTRTTRPAAPTNTTISALPYRARGLHTTPRANVSHHSHASAFRATSLPSARRSFSLNAAAATRSSSSSAVALLKRIIVRAVKSVRTGLARHQHTLRTHDLLRAFRTFHFNNRSPLLKGAIDAFRSSAARTNATATRNAYSTLGSRSITFTRGTLSGFGPRPAGGQLALSPIRGGVGLQSARKFSSGGARVFDNLIVNAPLALRLAADEVEEKSKLARRKPAKPPALGRAVGARRTGATFSGAKLPRNAYSFATATASASAANKNTTKHVAPSVITLESNSSRADFETELSTYFQFPQLPLTPFATTSNQETLVTIRLIDPLFVALGGRHPSPPTNSFAPRLFDEAFLHDANTALEYEHRRYLRAKAVLKALYDHHRSSSKPDQVETQMEMEMDLFSDPAQWTVVVCGKQPEEVVALLKRELGFDFGDWCTFTGISGVPSDHDEEGEGESLESGSVSESSSFFGDASVQQSEGPEFELLSPPSTATATSLSGREGYTGSSPSSSPSPSPSLLVGEEEMLSLSESLRSEAYDYNHHRHRHHHNNNEDGDASGSGSSELFDSRTSL